MESGTLSIDVQVHTTQRRTRRVVEVERREPQLLKDSGRCFACGKDNPQGLKLNVKKRPDGVELDYVLPEHFSGWQGIAHGGIVATILDELLAWACTNSGRNCVTAEMSVRYRKPVKTGSPLKGYGRVTGEKGRLLFTEAKLLDESGTLVAEASGKMMRVEGKVEE